MTARTPNHGFAYHLCSGDGVREISGFGRLKQVTSDCRPWHASSRLGAFAACGTVQKEANATWQTDAEKIYREYRPYSQADGAEQAAFDQGTGVQVSQSRMILENVDRHSPIAENG